MGGLGLDARARSAYPPIGAELPGPAVKSCSGGARLCSFTKPALREELWPLAEPPPEWKDDELEGARRRAGIMSSSPLVGCQSVMGLRRRSNSLELESFHLRNIVQRIAIPPREAAIAMRAVTVAVLVFEDADCSCGTLVSDGVADMD